MEEIFDLVDSEDRVIGQAGRSEVHGNPSLLHRVIHILVFNGSGELFLQKRAADRQVQPGKWDTSVGGHLSSGEGYLEAAVREAAEELGIEILPENLRFLYKYKQINDFEAEIVTSYELIHDGGFSLQADEIDDGRFWSIEEIRRSSPSIFTPNFLEELDKYLSLSSVR